MESIVHEIEKNLVEPIQLQLSKKEKIFCELFAAYLKSTRNVHHFERRDNPHMMCIFEIRDCQICG